MNTERIKVIVRENKFVRAISLPFAMMKRNYDLNKYNSSVDSKFIANLNNKHQGESCFIIGNGPSLTPEDLNKIHEYNIPSFGSNRIYHIYEQTTWRPTYYISLDVYGLSTLEEFDRIRNSGRFIKFLNYKVAKNGRKSEDNIHYIFTYGRFKINPYVMESGELSEDCSKHVSKTATVTANAIELAIYMGFKKIYLLGVDNNYARKKLANGKVIRDGSVKTSYFAGMKDTNGKPGDGFSVQVVDFMNEAYEICNEYAATHGIKIYNATRGGKLEIFERVDFDEVIKAFGRTK